MKKSFATKNKKESGQALLLTIIFLSIVLLTAVFITNIIITQFKLSGDIIYSLAAVYAADSGIEWQLYQIIKSESVAAPIMLNGATVSATTTSQIPNFTIKSLGSFGNIRREFEVSF